MKIKNIISWKKNLGSKRPYTIAFKTISDVDNVFVKVTLEDGSFGIGAGNPSEYVTGESIAMTHATLSQENLAFLIGRDLRDFYALLDEIMLKFPQAPAARAALDIALYDAFTKHLQIPLGRFLGIQIKSMPTSITIGIKNVEETLEEAQEYYDAGFRYLKVKTGNAVAEDIERMAKLREKFGNAIHIRVDANQGYDEAALIEFYALTKKFDIELIEQPLRAGMELQMKQLPDEIKAILAADESVLTPAQAFDLATPPGACGIFNIKLMKSGGIYPAHQIATIARYAGIDLMWGCNDESIVSIAAALHVAFSFPNTKYIDLDGSLDLMVDVGKGGFQLSDGIMSITDQPGLGVQLVDEPDEALA
ncbi:MAG: dipeptide epimerase [Cyclobacteriaceae bacterium]|nr:dipeptide epimerase [Cyclobacteriaceae bacterium]